MAKAESWSVLSAGIEQEALFRRLVRHKRPPALPVKPIGADLVEFYKKDIQRKQTRLSHIATVWQQLIPETLIAHTCLESFHAGTLKVLVDSSPHLYELKTVLLAGLQQQILLACRPVGLRRITLKPGRWYEGDDPASRRVTF
ncbi:MAG: DUF721 domain-containing protein [Phycisphaerae bacterium]|nr:DUF721 domain-containing protein [Phycisphaerae bacterium]MDW8262565.1 DciA family protein [Phycisphaerales bacterium]